jgi:hypothetical protein
VKSTKPNFILIQPAYGGPPVISPTTAIAGKPIPKNKKVRFQLSFSAKGVIADHLQVVP